MPESPSPVTELLLEWDGGSEAARRELVAVAYRELKRLAGAQLRSERPGHTLQATALVHEAYLRLVDQDRVAWRNRAQFFAVAARVMRRVLVDHARRRAAGKRGGGQLRVTLDESVAEAAAGPEVDLVALDAALVELEAMDPELLRLVEARFFGGLTIVETAELLGVSPATVKREWATARAWLRRRLAPAAPAPAASAPSPEPGEA